MNNINYINDYPTWKKEFKFYIPISVRFGETDMFGHMNNASALTYFEEARIRFFQSLGIYLDLHNPLEFPVVADIQCDYRKQVYFDEKIKLYIKVDSVGNSSFEMHYLAINDQNEICFTARGRIVNIDAKSGKPVILDENINSKLIQSMKKK